MQRSEAKLGSPCMGMLGLPTHAAVCMAPAAVGTCRSGAVTGQGQTWSLRWPCRATILACQLLASSRSSAATCMCGKGDICGARHWSMLRYVPGPPV